LATVVDLNGVTIASDVFGEPEGEPVVLDHLGVASARIVGHSMGGWVAETLALEHPDRVRAAELLGSCNLRARSNSGMKRASPLGGQFVTL
jgi:pyruvate dehydrogenase E2 component (dihydrolipoyllysine-residue acetyltransferase)